MFLLFLLLFLFFPLSPYFPLTALQKGPKSLSELCSEEVAKNYKNYDAQHKQKILLFVVNDLDEIPVVKPTIVENQEALVDRNNLEQRIDFIRLSFQSARMQRHQKLVLEIAKLIPNKYINPGMTLYRHLKQLPQDTDIMMDMCKVFDASDKYELGQLAQGYNQYDFEALLTEKNYNDLIKKKFWDAIYMTDLKKVKFFLQQGVPVSEPESFSQSSFTPLHLAAGANFCEIARLLLDNNADTAAQYSLNIWGLLTPLEHAIIWRINLCAGLPEISKDDFKTLEENFESKNEVCTLIASKCSLETLQHSYNETFQFLPESSPIKLFLQEQIILKDQK